jgi:excisionase family DNA binding protein
MASGTEKNQRRGRPATRQAEFAEFPRAATLCVPTTAQILNVSPHTIYLAADEGEIRAVRIGRVTRIPRSEVSRLLGNDPKAEIAVELPGDEDPLDLELLALADAGTANE